MDLGVSNASQSDVCTLLTNFLSMILTQFGRKVKMFRSDNGGEFFNIQCRELFNSHGIIHQSSCPYTPQQNGVVERKHRHILETARAIRFQGQLPIRFWGECILAVVIIINRVPSTVIGNKSPYYMLHKKQPDLSYMRTIGCLCYATKLIKGDKFGTRATKSVMLGYSSTQKGYKLYDWETKSIFVSQDVQFLEHIFPFQSNNANTLVNENEFLAPICPFSAIPIKSTPSLSPAHLPLESGDDIISTHEVPTNIDEVINAAHLPLESGVQTVVDEGTRVTIDETLENASMIQRRTSSRASRPPIWQKDFVAGSKSKYALSCLYPIANNVAYSGLSSSYQSYVAKMSTETEPTCNNQAVQDTRWLKAMQDEIQALEDNRTWKIVSLPSGKKAIGCKSVFKIKYKADGHVERFKARLVAKGYNQREGLDFQETFSPVVKMVTVRAVISLAATNGWCIQQMDVYNAFLQGDLHEDVYMQLPQGFKDDRTKDVKVWRLLKSLNGLKQASRQWIVKLTTALITTGFQQSHLDYSLLPRNHEMV
ncbi:hypothetical protein AABB24_006833 [Solanum stoloniferum]|uniref:Integrase catalytic domain-containing protein n=1 Tax=Solanum stoloniferum TaxID=62892 RepID=A0ABD2V755_9SOLN